MSRRGSSLLRLVLYVVGAAGIATAFGSLFPIDPNLFGSGPDLPSSVPTKGEWPEADGVWILAHEANHTNSGFTLQDTCTGDGIPTQVAQDIETSTAKDSNPGSWALDWREGLDLASSCVIPLDSMDYQQVIWTLFEDNTTFCDNVLRVFLSNDDCLDIVGFHEGILSTSSMCEFLGLPDHSATSLRPCGNMRGLIHVRTNGYNNMSTETKRRFIGHEWGHAFNTLDDLVCLRDPDSIALDGKNCVFPTGPYGWTEGDVWGIWNSYGR